jgi:hypothetical protein
MRSSTGTQAAAILAVARYPRFTVTVNGVAQPGVNSVSVDAQMTDTPDQISLLGGVAARQATLTYPRVYARALSPYQTSIVPAASPLPIGAAVVVSQQFYTNASATGTPVWSSNVFTGYIISVDLDASGDTTVSCQDASVKLKSIVSLPSAGVTPSSGLDLTQDLYYSPLAVIDACLRQSAMYLTAPPVLTGTNRDNFTVLSIPGVGGNIPDVGAVVQQYMNPGGSFVSRVARSTGKFTPDLVGSNGAIYAQTSVISDASAVPFTLYRQDFWFKTDATVGGGSNPYVFNGAAGVGGSCPTLGLEQAGGTLSVSAFGVTALADTTNCMNGAWHHVNIEFTRPSTTSVTFTLRVDGGTLRTSTQTITAGASLFPASLAGDPGSYFIVAGDGATPRIWIEALEVIFVPAGSTYSNPADRNGQTAGITSSVTATAARFQAIAPQSGTAWATIQSVAKAEGALCWFDEDGGFHFEPQTSWLARRTAAASRTFDASFVANAQISTNKDGLRKTVGATYQTVTAIASTAASPAYVADTVLTFPAGFTSMDIATDTRFFNPASAAIGATNVVGHTWLWPVPAASVGDPAAVGAPGVSCGIRPTATGFSLRILNRNSYPIALWNPTAGIIPQGPALVIHGTKIVTSDPIAVSQVSNPTAPDDLQLDDNPWRQDYTSTARLVANTAADTFSVIPVIQNITVPGDPRLQLGDVILLKVPEIPNGALCVVTNINQGMTSDGGYPMTLGIRPVGPPTGWIMGAAGRSEMGVTTYMPLPS